MVDSDLGLTVAFNGCIYNYPALREELIAAGYRFFSTSDTEVVLKAYHHWGTRCVEHFAGMFAFAIVERASGRLILARDRLGHQTAVPRRDRPDGCVSPRRCRPSSPPATSTPRSIPLRCTTI